VRERDAERKIIDCYGLPWEGKKSGKRREKTLADSHQTELTPKRRTEKESEEENTCIHIMNNRRLLLQDPRAQNPSKSSKKSCGSRDSSGGGTWRASFNVNYHASFAGKEKKGKQEEGSCALESGGGR